MFPLIWFVWGTITRESTDPANSSSTWKLQIHREFNNFAHLCDEFLPVLCFRDVECESSHISTDFPVFLCNLAGRSFARIRGSHFYAGKGESLHDCTAHWRGSARDQRYWRHSGRKCLEIYVSCQLHSASATIEHSLQELGRFYKGPSVSSQT